jgi:hypothetical protein
MVTVALALAALGLAAAPAASAESAQAPISVTVGGVASIEIGPEHPSDWPWPNHPCPLP